MGFEPENTVSEYRTVCRPPAKGRTDLYLLGVQGSGKSAMEASVLRYMTDARLLRYVPHTDNQGTDLMQPYYYGLMEALDEGTTPAATPIGTLAAMQFDIGRHFKKPLTMVDYSGKALKTLSEAVSVGDEAWDNPLGRSLKNDNPKTLVFVFDYAIVSGRDQRFSAIDQEMILDNVLHVVSTDGTGRYGDKGCTLEKVRNAAVVVTKSDLMEEDLGRPLSIDERADYAFDYLRDRCASFMNHLGDLCHKHDINANHKAHSRQVWVTTFSIGRPGAFADVDSRRIAEFIEATTAKRRLFGRL